MRVLSQITCKICLFLKTKPIKCHGFNVLAVSIARKKTLFNHANQPSSLNPYIFNDH